jgi:vacuolar-type H+-ATPase subunit E/Vma4
MRDDKAKVAAIRSVILKEAQEEADRILQAARQAAHEALEAAKAEADREAAAGEQQATERAESRLRANAASASAEARSRLLKARSEIMQQAVEGTAQRLDEIRARPEYPELLKALVLEAALTLAAHSDLTVLIDPRDASLVTDDFLGSVEIILTFSHNLGTKLSLGRETIETSGGAVLCARGSNIRCDNTLEERLRTARPELYRMVSQEVVGQ